MKVQLVCTGSIILWIAGGAVSNAVSNDAGFSKRFAITKRSTSCPWSRPNVARADNGKRAKTLLCAFTAERSSCDLCGKDETEYTFKLKTTKQNIQAFFKKRYPITIYSQVLHGNTKQTIKCDLVIKSKTRSSTIWTVNMKTECKKDTQLSISRPFCLNHDGNLITPGIDRRKCSIDCSEHPAFRLPCPAQQDDPPSNTAAIAGGVVGGVTGGVVITVVVVVVWWNCRKKRIERENDKQDLHIYQGLTPRSGASNDVTTTTPIVVPGVIKIAETTAAAETSTNEYQVLPDYRLAPGIIDVPNSQTPTPQTPNTQGEYVDLKDEKRNGIDISSREKACSRPLPVPVSESQNKEDLKDTYNRLGAHFEAVGQNHDYNGTDAKQDEHSTAPEVQSSPEYFVLGNDHEDQDTYNKLREEVELPGRTLDTHKKADDTETMNQSSTLQESGGQTGPSADYFVLENPESPGKQEP